MQTCGVGQRGRAVHLTSATGLEVRATTGELEATEAEDDEDGGLSAEGQEGVTWSETRSRSWVCWSISTTPSLTTVPPTCKPQTSSTSYSRRSEKYFLRQIAATTIYWTIKWKNITSTAGCCSLPLMVSIRKHWYSQCFSRWVSESHELGLGARSGPITTIPEPSQKPLAPPKPTPAVVSPLLLSQCEMWVNRIVKRGCPLKTQGGTNLD